MGAASHFVYFLRPFLPNCKQQPARADVTFPTIQIKIGYAYKSDTRSHKRLQTLQSSDIVKIDISLNEPIGETDVFEINDGNTIQVLMAEKFRALLQQEERNRIRRQDIYDIHYLLTNDSVPNNSIIRKKILEALITKSKVRGLHVDKDSMSNPEIIKRTKAEYDRLGDEIEGELPEFEKTYQKVENFYRILPWN